MSDFEEWEELEKLDETELKEIFCPGLFENDLKELRVPRGIAAGAVLMMRMGVYINRLQRHRKKLRVHLILALRHPKNECVKEWAQSVLRNTSPERDTDPTYSPTGRPYRDPRMPL